MRGRKLENYRPERKNFYCNDKEAWQMCKKRGINLSYEINRIIRFLAWGAETPIQARDLLIARINLLSKNMQIEMQKVEAKYRAEIAINVAELSKINDRIEERIETEKAKENKAKEVIL